MHIVWNDFTPWLSTLGGVLIGFAAVILMLGNGRIAGIVGIVGGLVKPVSGDWVWRLAFVLGMLAAPLVYGWFAVLPVVTVSANWPTLLIAGVVVGIGTRLGSGCTSGHGVCGIARMSRRSIVATACFMGSGFATVFVMRHVLA